MKDQSNPYIAPRSSEYSTNEQNVRRPPYVSATFFVGFFVLFELSAFVSPRDAPNAGIYVSVAWLSAWISGLIFRHMRISRRIRSMRFFSMLMGLSFATGVIFLMDSKPMAFTIGVVVAGIGTYLIHRQGLPADRPQGSA